MWKWLWNLEIGRGWISFEMQTRNMDVKDDSGEVSDRNEEHVTVK